MGNTWTEEWTSYFKSLKDTEYIVRICTAQATPSGTAKWLTLAADAITLQTDNSDDALKPSRITTGYLRVLNIGDLAGIIPESDNEHYVEVKTSSGRLLFCGFQQNFQFNKDMYQPNQVVELPLIDTLGALDTVKMDGSKEMGGESIASLLKEACDSLPGITRIVYPKTWTDAQGNYYGWMNLMANRLNWFEKNDSESIDEDLTRYNGMSYLQLLEEIAKLMGWTLVQKDVQLRFIALDATSYQAIGMADLETINAGGSVTPTELTIGGENNLETLQHGGMNNTSTVISGCKNVSVIGDVNPYDDLGISLGTEGAEYFGTYETRNGASLLGKGLVYRSKQRNLVLNHYELEAEDEHRMRAESDSYEPNADDPNLDSNTAPFYIDVQLEKYDTMSDDKKNWTFPDKPAICIRYKFQRDTAGSGEAWKGLINAVTLFKISGGTLQQQTGGCIDMHLTGMFGMNLDGRAQLKIGKYYWSQNGWGTTPANFTFGIIDGSIQNTKTLSMPYGTCTGYVIPLPDYVYGEVTFELKTFPEIGGNFGVPPIQFMRKWWINSIELNYVEALTADFNDLKDTVTYSSRVGENFKENKAIQLSLVTKTANCKNGIGVLMFGDHLFRKGDLKHNGASKIPEEVLLQKMKDWYGESKEVLSVELRTRFDVGEQINWNSKPYKVIACTWNMTDEIYEYKMIEL